MVKRHVPLHALLRHSVFIVQGCPSMSLQSPMPSQAIVPLQAGELSVE